MYTLYRAFSSLHTGMAILSGTEYDNVVLIPELAKKIGIMCIQIEASICKSENTYFIKVAARKKHVSRVIFLFSSLFIIGLLLFTIDFSAVTNIGRLILACVGANIWIQIRNILVLDESQYISILSNHLETLRHSIHVSIFSSLFLILLNGGVTRVLVEIESDVFA